MPTMPERERIKREFLSKFLDAREYPFLKYLNPLDFQVWCMMLAPRDLLIWSCTDEFQGLSHRIYDTNPVIDAWDWLIRLFFWPAVL